MVNIVRSGFQAHSFHLVSPSPWPFSISWAMFALAASAAFSFHNFNGSTQVAMIAFLLVFGVMSLWFKDITTEGTHLGDHTSAVQKGINLGFMLFVVSEGLFFLAIFWAFFHSALTPTVELGAQWPPIGIDPVNPFELPLLNTVLLLASAATITLSHHSLISNFRAIMVYAGIVTILLAVTFTGFQGVEYNVSSFTISDGAYGSTFYFGTGFHGFHVLVGTLLLLVQLFRGYRYHLTNNHHAGFENGIVYWHFVDIVWLVLYMSIYYWGS